MFCTRCGKPVDPSASFCSFCGAPVRAEAGGVEAFAAAPAAPAPAVASAPWSSTSPAGYGVPSAPQPAAPAPRYAGFWIRLLAYVVDAIVLFPVTWSIDRIMGVNGVDYRSQESMMDPAAITAHFGALCFQSIAWLVYSGLLESSNWQGTVGKLALGLKVTDAEGRRISIARAVGRNLGKFLSAILFGIGFLMVAFHQQKRGLHDLLAGTFVVRKRPA